jgi:CubicO group peptidase (beta-lactamase class C family)
VRTGDPGFTLSDPWVSERVCYADLLCHRSGLPKHAGDLLEDIGQSREAVLERLRLYPLHPFRMHHAYGNFGFAAAVVAAAAQAGVTWEDGSRQLLYEPLAMSSTSSTYAEFVARPNRATGHVRRDGEWMITPQPRQPDAQSPAGGISSTVNDMLRWLEMEMAGGVVGGQAILDPDALAETWLPHVISNPPDGPTGRARFYGIGLNVAYDDGGRLRVGHSGAFALGAGTAMTFFPAERVGVVVLTNGQPTGTGEAMVECFYDDLFRGGQTKDWVPLIGGYFDAMMNPTPKKPYSQPTHEAIEQGPDERYIGTCGNELYGPVEVTAAPDAGLQLTIGPDRQTYPLQPYDGDEMWWQFAGENAGPPAAATFEVGAGDRAERLTLDILDEEGLGTFTRS